MRAEQPSKRLFVAVLGVAVAGCGSSADAGKNPAVSADDSTTAVAGPKTVDPSTSATSNGPAPGATMSSAIEGMLDNGPASTAVQPGTTNAVAGGPNATSAPGATSEATATMSAGGSGGESQADAGDGDTGGSSSGAGQPGAGEGSTEVGGGGNPPTDGGEPDDLPRTASERISFGTTLEPRDVVSAARELAESESDSTSPQWQATGDQHRSYHFADTNTDEPYRIYVPTNWDGSSELPLVMFLHGAGSNENTYVDQNGGQLLNLAEQHGYVLVSPKGVDGAYGNFLRLSAPFGNQAAAAELMAQVTPESERTNELSERDVINVLELVLHEYPIDRAAMFLAGHSMGSGGTWYIGGKYSGYWTAIAPMSGPFVQESVYPWDDLRAVSIFVTEGTQTPSLDGSTLLAAWLSDNGFVSEYLEVGADHGGMIPLVLPDVFEFFEGAR